MRIKRTLLSVSNKHGLIPFAEGLRSFSVEILSTGGTAKALRAANVAVRDVADFTGFPEMLGGRVKTLHPLVHGGILGRRSDPGHQAEMSAHGILPIDMVVVNLYPFVETVASGAPFDDCVENIDIGGPAMIRSAAKNHPDVVVLVDPADYPFVLSELHASGNVSSASRLRLAQKAFQATSEYDTAVAAYFRGVMK